MRIRPPIWMLFLSPKLICNIATLGPLGYGGWGPGTRGSVVGILFYTVFFYPLSPALYGVFSLLFLYLGIVFCGEAEVLMRRRDPGEIILDEFVAIPFCFIGVGWIMERYPVWLVMVCGFLLFRFFDIFKFFGIKGVQRLEGGLGIVGDDVVAALLTCICLHLGFWGWGWFVLC